MIRPASFGYNPETAGSNAFQKELTNEDSSAIQSKAIFEFDRYTDILRNAGINVIVVQDTAEPRKPDAVFPNNWFSTHMLESGERILFIYPMLSVMRRSEVRHDLIETLAARYGFEVRDHSVDTNVLEGTGSIVFDHSSRKAYAALSPRTDSTLLSAICGELGYEPVIFTATDRQGRQVYHTNVILTIGESFAVICSEMIRDDNEMRKVLKSISDSGKEIISISEEQVNSFAGNMLQLRNADGDKILVMSKRAFEILDDAQKEKLRYHNSRFVETDIETIETAGGGSARCMLAEIFH